MCLQHIIKPIICFIMSQIFQRLVMYHHINLLPFRNTELCRSSATSYEFSVHVVVTL
ncbi:hypothetical protein [Staphylococcus phage ASZ22RN]|nr:hypothetical protein [Staphylococcus phage ASZ22RN]